MTFWQRWFGGASRNDEASPTVSLPPVVNPSTGLPMIDGNIGGIDVGGSPYGTDIHHPSPEPWTPPPSHSDGF